MVRKKGKLKKIQKRDYSLLYWLLGASFFYLALALVFTYPLVLNLNSSIIGDPKFTDGPFFLWNLWWVQKASQLHLNPFVSNYVYYPSETNLTLHTLTFTRGLLSLPLQKIFSLIAVNNILQIGSIVFSALGTYCLVLYLSKDKVAGIISGIIFAFSPFVSSHLLAGHINLADLALFPFVLLFFIKMIREDGWLNSILGSTLLVGICLNDLQIGFYLGILLLVVVIVEASSNYRKFFDRKKLLQIAFFILIFAIYFLIPYLLLVKGFWSQETLGATYSNGDLRSYLMANPLNPFSNKENLIFTKSLIGGYRENSLAIGWAASAFAIASLIFIRKNLKEKLLFFAVAIIFIVLSMGPHFQSNRQIYDIHLPFFYLQNLKVFSIGIVTTRFMVVTYLAIAILAGFLFSGLRSFLDTRKSKLLTTLFYVTYIFAIFKVGIADYSGTMMMTKLEPSPTILEEIKNDNEDANVLISMCGVAGSYYQTKMDKRVISGSLGRRVHEYYMTKYQDYPGVNLLTNYDNKYIYKSNASDMDRSKIEESLVSLDVKYILLCKRQEEDKYAEVRDYLSKFDLNPYKEDGFVVLYKLK